jgi:putative flippase GtrA
MKATSAMAHACGKHPAPSLLVRWCRFNFVGGIGIGVQFAALFLLKGVLHVNYLAATALAVEAAVLHNFVWHGRFTWADRNKHSRAENRGKQRQLARLLRFHLSNGVVSILGNVTLMKVLVGQAHMNYLVANAIAISVCSLANFAVSENWVFERS